MNRQSATDERTMRSYPEARPSFNPKPNQLPNVLIQRIGLLVHYLRQGLSVYYFRPAESLQYAWSLSPLGTHARTLFCAYSEAEFSRLRQLVHDEITRQLREPDARSGE